MSFGRPLPFAIRLPSTAQLCTWPPSQPFLASSFASGYERLRANDSPRMPQLAALPLSHWALHSSSLPGSHS